MFLVSSLFFFVWFPCGRLSWLHVSFWAHVNIVHHIISYHKDSFHTFLFWLLYSIMSTFIILSWPHGAVFWSDCKPEEPLFSAEFVCWPDCKPEGPLFSAAFVCLCVCLWPALLPFNVDRFWWNLVTRTLLWSSLAATIIFQVGRRGTAWQLLKISKNSQKSQNMNFKSLIHHFFCVCVSCVL